MLNPLFSQFVEFSPSTHSLNDVIIVSENCENCEVYQRVGKSVISVGNKAQ